MLVIVDKNNPCVTQAFQQFGEVRALSTAEITKEAVRDAEILIIRSETKVSKELLDDSAVRFVGSATIGTDHVDIEYVRSTGRSFANAPGSNANSVAEYIVAALLCLSQKKSFSLRGKSIGVVGVGNVGSKVVRYAAALGLTVLQNDPPLARTTGHSQYVPLDALMACDIITLHVPLTKTGDDPTYHLFSQERIAAMKHGAILINTARGAVVDGNALKKALNAGRLSGAVLDVWENEPEIDIELLQKVDIGTAHIAGYSYDGKVAAVKMLYDEACHYFKQKEQWFPNLNSTPTARRRFNGGGELFEQERAIHEIVRRNYDIMHDDMALRSIIAIREKERRMYFQRLRSEYTMRREFFNSDVENAPKEIRETLRAIGFRVA